MDQAPVIIPATEEHTSSIIFLHGIGGSGRSCAKLLEDLKPPFAKLICPTAPTIPMTCYGGTEMSAWFDLKSIDPPNEDSEDEAGIVSAAVIVQKLIDEEMSNGIPSEKIMIGGFSMGGALALYLGLSQQANFGGIIGLSCWIPLHKKFPYDGGNSRDPVLQCHGEEDDMLDYKEIAVKVSHLLNTHLSNYKFISYPNLGHECSDLVLKDVKCFFEEKL